MIRACAKICISRSRKLPPQTTSNLSIPRTPDWWKRCSSDLSETAWTWTLVCQPSPPPHSPASLEKLKENKTRLSTLGIKFAKNIAEDTTHILCTREGILSLSHPYLELDGLDDSFVNELEKVDGKFKVTVQYTDLLPVMRMCKVVETRKRLDVANSSRCKENIPMLEEAVQIRQKNAELLGYPSHSHYQLEIKMAKTPETVLSFLGDLKDKLLPMGVKELEHLKQLKKKDVEAAGGTFDGSFNSWDWAFYNRMLLETEYQVNHEKIKEYFAMERVTTEMLNIYEGVLGLKFQDCTEKYKTWHPDVKVSFSILIPTCTFQAFEVHDAAGNDFVGVFYLDLYPRDGKYKHAAVFPLRPGYSGETEATRTTPCAAMVANFAKPTVDRPSLLKHDEIVRDAF